jgi:2-oxoglutarate ferredoxin oxidoreductase subunit alpha
MHRIGGLEKQDITGNVSYDPINHEHMVNLRARKVAGIAAELPPQPVTGPRSGRLLVLSWGGTYGACATAVQEVAREGGSVAHAHLRYLNPLPADLGEIIRNYDRVLVPELNRGQLRLAVRAEYLVDAVGLNKVQGKPFAVREVVRKIRELLQ